MTRQKVLWAGAFWIFILLLALPLNAQLYTGTISGQVTDPSGAVVPQAQVTALDTERQYIYGRRRTRREGTLFAPCHRANTR